MRGCDRKSFRATSQPCPGGFGLYLASRTGGPGNKSRLDRPGNSGGKILRLHTIVDDQGLIQKLEDFIQNKAGIADCWQGQVKESRRILALLGDDADSQTLLHQWTTKRKLDKIGQYWVCGGKIAWELLYGPNKPRRVNLPSYPFAKLRYWIAETQPKRRRLLGRCCCNPAGASGRPRKPWSRNIVNG